MARIAEQCLAVTQCTDYHVTLHYLRHAAGGEFERVVGALVVQHFGYNDDTFIAGDVVRGDAQLATETAGLRNGTNLIDDDGLHHGVLPPARVWNMPGSASILE